MGVRTYGQYCPIARASELLAERWSIIILRNIVILGCRSFNEIADGAPGLSRGLLSHRLRDLERAGVIEIRPKSHGPGSMYEPTQAGRELSEVMVALQHWGSKVGGADARTGSPGRGAVDVGDVLPGPRPPPSTPGANPLRLPDAVGAGQPELAAGRAGRRRDLREVPRRRGAPGRRGQRSGRVRPLAPWRNPMG
jgi:DNA-binding HxlR family transcriptional regulator